MQKSYFITSIFTAFLLLFITITPPLLAQINSEPEIPLTEDLMREHGILNRVMLIYEEIIKRIDKNESFALETVRQAVNIIQTFIENYHEKMEEEFLFPLFEKHNKEMQLVRTLKKQHDKGREITAQINKLLALSKPLNQKQKKNLKNLLRKFITMYRPHEAREDTVLFPQVRLLISEAEFKELGEKSDDLEHAIFGQNGFEMILKKVETIEKELGIYQLDKFTPII